MAIWGLSRSAIEGIRYLMKSPIAEVRNKMEQGVGVAGHTKVKAERDRLPAMVSKNRINGCLPYHMAIQSIGRYAGGAMEWVHLPQTLRHLRLQCHLHHRVTIRELKVPESTVCHPDICIYLLLFPMLNLLILMHIPRISSAIKIIFQICWLMKEHPLVSTLSAAR